MKDHAATLAMLVALLMLLVTVVVLASEGSKADGPLLIGLGAAVGTITGAIAGKQISNGNSVATPPPGGSISIQADNPVPQAPVSQPPATKIQLKAGEPFDAGKKG